MLHERSKKIRSIQRLANIRIIRAYRTISHEAAQVLSGIVPIDLRVLQLASHYFVKNHHHQVPFIDKPPLINSITGNSIKQEIKLRIITEWQTRWNNSTKGRHTYEYFPNIGARLEDHIELDHILTQFYSGHGNFGSYLHRFNLRDTADCTVCGTAETPQHLANDCSRTLRCRTNLHQSLSVEEPPADLLHLMLTQDAHLLHIYLKEISAITTRNPRILTD